MVDNTKRSEADSDKSVVPSRRKLLAAIGGTMGIAGCLGSGNSEDTTTTTPDTTETVPNLTTTTSGGTTTSTTGNQTLPHVSGQTFQFPIGLDPAQMQFLKFGRPDVIISTQYNFPRTVWRSMMEPEIVGRWYNRIYWPSPGKVYYRLFENVEFLDDGLRMDIREDATWSDGEPITARDGAGCAAIWRLSGLEDTFKVKPANANNWHTFDSIEMPDGPDGKTYILRDPRGVMDKYSKGSMLARGVANRLGVNKGATHIEPAKSMADAALENVRIGREGGDFKNRSTIIKETVTKEDFERHRDPENVVTSGPWTLDEIRGSKAVVVKPNEHWRNADEVNFDEIRFTYQPNDRREHAALQSDNLDYSWGPKPQRIVEALPDNITGFEYPGGSGNGLGFDHHDPHLGKRNVRAAMAYVMDKQAIAKNVNQTNKPITRFGAGLVATDIVTTRDWVDNNLVDYSQNVERADQLMRDAGYTKEGGTWTSSDGEQLSYELPSTSNAPAFGQTVANQLSNFGIQTQVQTYDNATYSDKWDNGDFQIWPTGGWMTDVYTDVSTFWWHNVNKNTRITTWNFYPPEDQAEAVEQYSGANGFTQNWRLWEDLYIDIPPVGQPDGTPQRFRPSYHQGRTARGPGEKNQELWHKYFWAANWWIPTLPIFQSQNIFYHDTSHWLYTKEHPLWDYFGVSINMRQELAMNLLKANPENPEGGATVEG